MRDDASSPACLAMNDDASKNARKEATACESAGRAPGSERTKPRDFVDRLGFLAPLCLAARHASEALSCAARFSRLWSERSFSLEHDGELSIVRMPLSPVDGESEFDAAASMPALWLELIERVRGSSTAPRALYLPRVRGEPCESLCARFSCAVQLDRTCVALVLERKDLEARNPAHDPGLYKLLTQFAEDRLCELHERESTALGVQRILRAFDHAAEASAERVALLLGLGVRTLHRRLRAEGTSYRRVVAEFRMQRCEAQIGRSSSAKNIAYALGFASPASFHRAFKRWTGCTVGEYRRQQQAAASAEGDAQEEAAP
jgi:AraC-like DNA-binding protein